jgi:sugar phosphate isomerase/epimerase
MDGANIFHKGELPRMREILDETFDLLGDHVVLAHAKDLDHDGDAGHLPAGKGLLDYHHYLSLFKSHNIDVPIILHGLSEVDTDECVSFLRKNMD